MDTDFTLILPFALVLARVSAFVAVLPIFSWQTVPMIVRAGLALLLSAFFICALPTIAVPAGLNWVWAVLLVVGEMLTGLALGLAANLVFMAVQQGGRIAGMQMGLSDAGVIDPVNGEETEALSLFMETTFVLFFLAAGGHHLLLMLLGGSYDVFPAGQMPNLAAMADGIVRAGSQMMVFALQLAGPILAAFLVLAVVLAILARILPDMNILFESYPIRVGTGLIMAAAMIPVLNSFAYDLKDWMAKYLLMT
jgi:flagellar biosynthesis protein FliR